MPNTVFFSWQTDTENRVGRSFIARALERAARQIGDDTSVEKAMRDVSVDRDTKGVPGSPPIVDTIFRKIDTAAVFVPDLTFVGQRLDGRPAPNPNVLIEYGWALKSLGHSRIVPVMNTAFGTPTEMAMPFNLRHLRNPILYSCPPDIDDDSRMGARQGLARDLESAIRLVLTSDEFRATMPQPPSPQRFQAVSASDGPGRFRKRGEALGIWDGHLTRPSEEVFLAEGPIIWLRVMPRVHLDQRWSVTELMSAVKTPNVTIDPLFYTAGGLYFLRAGDGFGVYTPFRSEVSQAGQISFVFCNGEIWGIDAYLLPAMTENGQRFIPDLENALSNTLQSYTRFLIKIGISAPFSWEAGMENTKGRALYSKDWSPLRAHRLCALEPTFATGDHSPDDPPRRSLRPFFTALFDACGAEWVE